MRLFSSAADVRPVEKNFSQVWVFRFNKRQMVSSLLRATSFMIFSYSRQTDLETSKD